MVTIILNLMSEINLSVNLCGIQLTNPAILASGILGTTKALLKRVAENGAGAVTIKSISVEPRERDTKSTVITFEAGMLNAVGYSNPGVDAAAREFTNLQDVGVPVIASVIGTQKEDFVRVVEGLSFQKFFGNRDTSFLSTYARIWASCRTGHTASNLRYNICSKKVTKLPIFVKLSPNIPEICTIAKAAEDAGADAITAVNSMGPGMIINIEPKSPF